MKPLRNIKEVLLSNLPLTLFVASFIIFGVTSGGRTPYDYFTRLAEAFLEGRYWITNPPEWLSELVPAGGNKYYVIQPPMPAILSMPFVALLGKYWGQRYLAHLLGAGSVALTMKLSQKISKDTKLMIWSGLLVGFGTIIWFLSSVGSVWYLGQVSAFFFLTAGLVEGLNKKRPLVVGIFVGAAYLSRLHTILSLPLFLFLLKDKLNFKGLLFFGIGAIPFAFANAIYNFVRFDTVWDKGYFLIPGILSEPWFAKGMLNPAYIVNHLKLLFFKLPNLLPRPPYIQPSWYGLAIWITTPAFIYSLKAPIKTTLAKMSWLSVLLIFLLVALRGGTGWTQFGYRYAVDFYPFLVLLTILGVSKEKLQKHHWVLLFVGIIVNLWGVLWINKFGWVSY